MKKINIYNNKNYIDKNSKHNIMLTKIMII